METNSDMYELSEMVLTMVSEMLKFTKKIRQTGSTTKYPTVTPR